MYAHLNTGDNKTVLTLETKDLTLEELEELAKKNCEELRSKYPDISYEIIEKTILEMIVEERDETDNTIEEMLKDLRENFKKGKRK